MKSKLDYALEWGARGFSVFPCFPGTKTARVPFLSVNGADPRAITALWTDPVTGAISDDNVGVGTTGFVVVDVDIKNGKPGLDSFLALGGDFNSLTVKSPTGGYHVYYRGPDSSGTIGRLGVGIDIRSHHNYVLAPGSTTPHGTYELFADKPMCFVPPDILRALKPPRAARPPSLASDGTDKQTSIDAALHWVKHNAPISIAGMNGDDNLYNVVARLRTDYDLSSDTVVSMLVENWNERCQPPWGIEDIAFKVENAPRFNKGTPGSIDPGLVISQISVPAPIYISQEARARGVFDFGNFPDLHAIKPRQWIMERFLLPGYVTALAGPGAAGKSSVTIAGACHVAAGRPWLHLDVPRARRVVLVNAEDSREEMAQRVMATCMAYKLDYSVVMQNMALVPGDEYPLMMAVGRDAIPHMENIALMCAICLNNDVGFVGMDPLIELHESDENDNTSMRKVMGAMREFARQSATAVWLNHHVAKGAGTPGDIDSFRGGSSIGANVRIAKTLFEATEEDKLAYSLPPNTSSVFVRLDDAKANVYRKADKPVWLRREAFIMPNREMYPAYLPADVETLRLDEATKVLRDTAHYIQLTGMSIVPFPAVLDHLVQLDMSFAVLDAKGIKARKEVLRRKLMQYIGQEGVVLPNIGRLELPIDKGKSIGATIIYAGVRLT